MAGNFKGPGRLEASEKLNRLGGSLEQKGKKVKQRQRRLQEEDAPVRGTRKRQSFKMTLQPNANCKLNKALGGEKNDAKKKEQPKKGGCERDTWE